MQKLLTSISACHLPLFQGIAQGCKNAALHSMLCDKKLGVHEWDLD